MIQQMAESLKTLLGATDSPVTSAKMLGIKTGGVIHPQVGASKIPFSVEGEIIILVDDVLYSGRTIRAAMNEIFDYGRPEKIILATLVERSGRELPINANVIGRSMDLPDNQQVKLRSDMSLEIIRE